jgi:hypothetical protein
MLDNEVTGHLYHILGVCLDPSLRKLDPEEKKCGKEEGVNEHLPYC